MKSDVFISYSRADYVDFTSHKEIPGNVISKLMRAFDEAGITYWIDKEGIHSGDAWAKLIGKAIGNSAIFLFVSSANSNRSDCWSADEIALARNKKKHIIPFLLDDTPFNDEFALFIARLDYVDYASIGDSAITKLVESIDTILDDKVPNRKTIRELKRQQGELRDEIKRIESERRYVVTKLKELGVDVNDETTIDSADVKRLKCELEAQDRELRDLRRRNADLQSEKDSLMVQCQNLQNSLDESKMLNEALSAEIEKKTAEINLQEEACKEKDKQIAKLQTEVARLSEYERREKGQIISQMLKALKVNALERELIQRRNNMVWYDESSHSLRWRDKEYKLIKVKGGTFTMGATPEQGSESSESEKPEHKVTLSDYCIGQTPVPQWLWQAAMGENPSWEKGENLPVESVTWNDCQDFIKKLYELTDMSFALPTEAQWEYAARGGNKSKGYKYSGSNEIDEVAWYEDNSDENTHEVGTKNPNELGLYDMTGNVFELCADWYDQYSSEEQTDPTGPSSGFYHVIRGGSWANSAKACRVSYRNDCAPTDRRYILGLRLILPA